MSKNEIDYNQCANYLSKRDLNLEKLVKKYGIIKLPPKEDPFTKFIKIIVNQQLSNKAASTIFSRLQSKISKFNPTYIQKLDEEVLDTCYVYNANNITRKIFSLISPFLNKDTKNKIVLY